MIKGCMSVDKYPTKYVRIYNMSWTIIVTFPFGKCEHLQESKWNMQQRKELQKISDMGPLIQVTRFVEINKSNQFMADLRHDDLQTSTMRMAINGNIQTFHDCIGLKNQQKETTFGHNIK